MSDIAEMYGNEEEESFDKIRTTDLIKINDRGSYKDVVINGEHVIIVDYQAFKTLVQSMASLQKKIARMENELKMANVNIRKMSASLKETRTDLDSKIGYE